jgi:predicted neutral ceramidase superfamily lipid hydrolase
MRKICYFLLLGAVCAAGASSGGLRAGAARVDIKPAADAALPMSGYGSRVQGHQGVHDPIHVRALVLDDGERQAALISCELLWVTEELYQRMAARISRESGIPPDAILMAATHTHAAPSPGAVKPEFEARWKPWRAALEDRLAEAVRLAQSSMQPVRVGAGLGKVAGGWE